MHYSVLNCATVRVADTRDVSGGVTAGSINDGSGAERKSSLWRACGLTIFCSVVSVGILASLTPLPALADDDEERGVRKEIAALKKEVAALQSQVEALQDQLAAVQSNNALKLGKFVIVDPNPENGVRGPNITFKGANIHIISGSGATDDNLSHGGSLTGRGNLIIGYDEFSGTLPAGARGGSHNLVIGPRNQFTSTAFGGLVVGDSNTISAQGASVSAGLLNVASGPFASVSGGGGDPDLGLPGNTASGFAASVSGGGGNTASGLQASVSGGSNNTASGSDASVSGGGGNTASDADASVSGGDENKAISGGASVSGGFGNTASGGEASVSGGQANTASGEVASVSGGIANTASGEDASVSGGEVNTASGVSASVNGGEDNTASGELTVVIGGTGISDTKHNSIAPNPPFP